VFEPGFTTRSGGTGFGLAIVAEIVDAHGWNARVTESEAGGARFEITDAPGRARDSGTVLGNGRHGRIRRRRTRVAPLVGRLRNAEPTRPGLSGS
jgi:hypothetical protein